MPTAPTAVPSEASRRNERRSAGSVTESGRARSAINATRHGRTGRTFFLLADEDPAEFAAHEASWLAIWRPRRAGLGRVRHPRPLAEIRADRLEAQILSDLFDADGIEDEALRLAVKAAAMKALSTLLRYRAQITRENAAAMRDLDSLRQRRLDLPQPPRQSEPETTLNRHQRRALAARARHPA